MGMGMKKLAPFTHLLALSVVIASPAIATPADASAAATEERAVATSEQETAEATADRLFREGRELLKQGKYDEACPKLEQSHRLDPALGTLLNLGVCYEELGKVASAWTVYREVASQARELAQFEREALAQERIAALEPELPRIVLDFGGALPTLVSLNDQPLPSDAWDSPLPVDPGTHRVEVRSAGHGVWKQQVQVARAQSRRVVVPLLTVAATNFTAPHSVQQLARLPDDRSKDSGQPSARNIAMVLGGLGGGAAIAGTVFGILAYSSNASSDDECGPRGACTSKGRELRETASDQAAVSTVAFGIAAASVTGALVLWLTAPDPAPKRSAVRFRAAASPAHIELGTGVDF